MKPGGETLTFGPNYIYSGGGGVLSDTGCTHGHQAEIERQGGGRQRRRTGEAGMGSRTERLVKERRDSMPSKVGMSGRVGRHGGAERGKGRVGRRTD